MFSKNFLNTFKNIFYSNYLIIFYLLILYLVILHPFLNNFFVADDFSWIHWSKSSRLYDLFTNFYDAKGFFLRPVDKAVFYFEYIFFGLNSFYYNVINLLLNVLASIGAYLLFFIIFKKKSLAFLSTIIFSFSPSHSQNLFWIATISTTLSTFLILFGLILFYFARLKKNYFFYLISLLLFTLSIFTYENAVIFIFILYIFDLFLIPKKFKSSKTIKYLPYVFSVLILAVYFLIRFNSNAAGFSGDYNYNFTKAIPNSVGNYLGYMIMFFTAENFLNVYQEVRNSLKVFWFPISIAGFFTAAFLGGFFIEHKEKIYLSKNKKIFIFGFLFSFFSLLPYLPLGNITLRYIYLGSFGFVVMLAVFLDSFLFIKIKTVTKNYFFLLLSFLIFIICLFYLRNIGVKWELSSKITRTVFNYFKNTDINNANVYFYNIPIKKGEAYIFPVGLIDLVGLSAPSKNLTIYIAPSFEIALSLFENDINNNVNSVIYTFDNQNKLKKINEKKN